MFSLYFYYFNIVLAILKDLRWWKGMRLRKLFMSRKQESETHQGEGDRALT